MKDVLELVMSALGLVLAIVAIVVGARAGARANELSAQIAQIEHERRQEEKADRTVQAHWGNAPRNGSWVWGLVVLSVVLVALTILVSPTRRRTVIQLGIGVIVAVVFAVLVLRRVEAAVIGEISSPARTETAASILEQLFQGLRQGIVGLILVSALLAIGFHIAGRPKWVTDTGQRLDELMPGEVAAGSLETWVAANYDFIRVTLAGLVLLVLFITGIGWVSLMIVGGTAAVALWWLARLRDRATRQTEVPS